MEKFQTIQICRITRTNYFSTPILTVKDWENIFLLIKLTQDKNNVSIKSFYPDKMTEEKEQIKGKVFQ